jgi:hypothetical protein
MLTILALLMLVALTNQRRMPAKGWPARPRQISVADGHDH